MRSSIPRLARAGSGNGFSLPPQRKAFWNLDHGARYSAVFVFKKQMPSFAGYFHAMWSLWKYCAGLKTGFLWDNEWIVQACLRRQTLIMIDMQCWLAGYRVSTIRWKSQSQCGPALRLACMAKVTPFIFHNLEPNLDTRVEGNSRFRMI